MKRTAIFLASIFSMCTVLHAASNYNQLEARKQQSEKRSHEVTGGFIGKVPVKTSRGDFVPIEDLEQGSYVETSEQPSLVSETHFHEEAVLSQVVLNVQGQEYSIASSEDQWYWVVESEESKGKAEAKNALQRRTGWVKASELQSGEKIYSNVLGAVEVIEVRTVRHPGKENFKVHNLTVDGVHVYYITEYEFLVHNAWMVAIAVPLAPISAPALLGAALITTAAVYGINEYQKYEQRKKEREMDRRTHERIDERNREREERERMQRSADTVFNGTDASGVSDMGQGQQSSNYNASGENAPGIANKKYNPGDKIDLDRFSDRQSRNGQRAIQRDPKTGEYLERDKGGNNSHGGSHWKLKDKKDRRLGTVTEDGTILRD